MQEITVTELKSKLDAGADLVVLDVREPHEWKIAAIDGTLRIPKGEIEQAKNAVTSGSNALEETVLAQIPQDKELIVHCRSGKRSADTINFLKEAGYDSTRMYNLVGGILAWADKIDPSQTKY